MIHLAIDVIVKPHPTPTRLSVPSLFPHPVKYIPGNLQEFLSLGDLKQPGDILCDNKDIDKPKSNSSPVQSKSKKFKSRVGIGLGLSL